MISPFEYVTVLISIILGMGITQIVSGLAQIIHRWEKVRIYWPHLVLIILVFIIHIQEWWIIYEMEDLKYWRLATFLFTILYPVNLYILARILFPIDWKDGVVDLKLFYYQNFRRIYLFIISLDVLAIIDNVLISGYAIRDQLPQLSILTVLAIVASRNKRNEFVHHSVAVFLLLIAFITIALTWNTLLIQNH
ncbi:MAG: hypothetical protein ACOYXT_09555 [Bacteroidota bacterium]